MNLLSVALNNWGKRDDGQGLKMNNILLLLLAGVALVVVILWWQNLIGPAVIAIALVLLAMAGVGTRVWSDNSPMRD